jgi:hypothetical protein
MGLVSTAIELVEENQLPYADADVVDVVAIIIIIIIIIIINIILITTPKA